MRNLVIGDLTYALISPAPGPHAPADERTRGVAAYRLWKTVWSKTFRELDHRPTVFSDDFCRQTFLGGLFRQDRCLALGLFRDVDLSHATTRDDSYFAVWPEKARLALAAEGPRITVGSNITVDEDFRGRLPGGIQLKHLVVGLMVKTFLESESDAMTGTMRCDKNMHAAAKNFGATPLEENIIHHGVPVELVAFYRARLANAGFTLADLGVEMLWRNRVDFRPLKPSTFKSQIGAKP